MCGGDPSWGSAKVGAEEAEKGQVSYCNRKSRGVDGGWADTPEHSPDS